MKQFIVVGLFLACALSCNAIEDETCISENDIGEVPKTIRSDLYRGQQAFTVSMLQAIQAATPNENVFFSPYSTYHALLLAYFGASNHTQDELVKALNLQWAKNKNHVIRGYRLEKQMRELRSKRMPLDFDSADKIYFNENIKLTDCIQNSFVDELESLNFVQRPEECRMAINSWIANITHNQISELLQTGDISADTEMVLANAAYFKGQWSNQFDPKLTTQDIFYTTPTKQSFVPMMHKRGLYNLGINEQLGAYVAQMPYKTSEDDKESEISMIIILPPFEEGSLEKVLQKLTPESLARALDSLDNREIEISLPKFEFEQNLELVPILRKLGINSIFENTADLSGFSTKSHMSFGDAKHLAKIKIDEEGSTAAAATVVLSFRSARPLTPTKFECNHPFLFLIYDYTAKAVLFTGIYRDPMTQK